MTKGSNMRRAVKAAEAAVAKSAKPTVDGGVSMDDHTAVVQRLTNALAVIGTLKSQIGDAAVDKAGMQQTINQLAGALEAQAKAAAEKPAK